MKAKKKTRALTRALKRVETLHAKTTASREAKSVKGGAKIVGGYLPHGPSGAGGGG
jgi:hypothetical protein